MTVLSTPAPVATRSAAIPFNIGIYYKALDLSVLGKSQNILLQLVTIPAWCWQRKEHKAAVNQILSILTVTLSVHIVSRQKGLGDGEKVADG